MIEGKLLPYFIAVSNTKPRDIAVVASGNERVSAGATGRRFVLF